MFGGDPVTQWALALTSLSGADWEPAPKSEALGEVEAGAHQHVADGCPAEHI
jgi:hypothetical protein